MARPKKQTVDYFPHFVNSGKTIFILEQTYGNDGYAFWFKLLELLGSTDGHYYDCRNTPAWKFLLAKTRVDEETAIEILDLLVELEAIDRELWEHRIIWSNNFVNNLSPVYSNRKSELPKKPVVTSKNGNTDEFLPVETEDKSVSTGKNSQSKVKESKVKESKENNTMSQQSSDDDKPTDIKFDEDSVEIQLARFMISEMLRVKPDSKVPKDDVKSLQSWAKHIDYMIRLDKRTPKQIAELFRWAQNDTFWCANIRSPQKLRKQWDTLELQRSRSKRSPNKNLSKLEQMYREALEEEGTKNEKERGY